MKDCFLEKVTDSANGQIFTIPRKVTFFYKEKVLYHYVNFTESRKGLNNSNFTLFFKILNCSLLFPSFCSVFISVVLTYKYLGLFFNFQMFCMYPSATNSAHLFKIYSSVVKRKINFSFRNLICCMKICQFLKTVMMLAIFLLSITIIFFFNFQNLHKFLRSAC